MSKILDIYLNESFVGKLIREAGNLHFQYNEAYIDSKFPLPISVCMPLQLQPYTDVRVKAFFSGILPDDIARHRLARYLGISEKNSFALLEAIGGECAGALALYPEGHIPPISKIEDIEKLDNKRLVEILDLLKQRPLLAGSDNIRLSLAGAQDKLAVRLVENTIALAKGTTPTSHILKPMIDGIKDSVYNEYFCLRLAKLVNLDVPEAEIRWANDTPYFLIERYDRIKIRQRIKRLHQEDFCQALGIPPDEKYEREGGPSVSDSLQLIQSHSLHPASDFLAFIRRIIFNYLIGNSDAHGKNYSFLYKGLKPILAPAYDLMCTAIYPGLDRKMAMKIGSKYDPDHVFKQHWHRLVFNTVVAKKVIDQELVKLSKDCRREAIGLKFALKEKGIYSTVFDDICIVIEKRAARILG